MSTPLLFVVVGLTETDGEPWVRQWPVEEPVKRWRDATDIVKRALQSELEQLGGVTNVLVFEGVKLKWHLKGGIE